MALTEMALTEIVLMEESGCRLENVVAAAARGLGLVYL
jgi:hypothetical protein